MNAEMEFKIIEDFVESYQKDGTPALALATVGAMLSTFCHIVGFPTDKAIDMLKEAVLDAEEEMSTDIFGNEVEDDDEE